MTRDDHTASTSDARKRNAETDGPAELWATAREYDEQWPADTRNDAALLARLALAERERLEAETDEYDALITRQGNLLTGVVNALRGDPPPLTTWSHHDAPELAARMRDDAERAEAEAERLREELDEHRAHYVDPQEYVRLVIEGTDLRRKLAAVEALADEWAEGPCGCYAGRYCLPCASSSLRAALDDERGE